MYWFIKSLVTTYLPNYPIKTILICPINCLIRINVLHMDYVFFIEGVRSHGGF
jgi:hypothetical protein